MASSNNDQRQPLRRRSDSRHRRLIKWGGVVPLAAFGGWKMLWAAYSAIDPLWEALGRFLGSMVE